MIGSRIATSDCGANFRTEAPWARAMDGMHKADVMPARNARLVAIFVPSLRLFSFFSAPVIRQARRFRQIEIEQCGTEALAMGVERQRARDAAAQGAAHDEVQGA